MTDQMFGAQTTSVLQKGTVYLGTLFMVLSLVLAILIGNKNYDAALEGPESQETPAAAETPPAVTPAVPETEKPSSIKDEVEKAEADGTPAPDQPGAPDAPKPDTPDTPTTPDPAAPAPDAPAPGSGTPAPPMDSMASRVAILAGSPAAKPQRRPGALDRLDSEWNTSRLSSAPPSAAAACRAPGGGASL